jgi:glutathione S-transferase
VRRFPAPGLRATKARYEGEMPMTIELYYAPNTCALAPYVTLTEANASFEVHPLNFRKHQQMSADYLKLNPKHKVPLLIVDGRPLTESTAIQMWIARNFPQAKLLPADPWQELQAISIMSWCSSGVHPYLQRINNPPRVCDVPGAEPSVIKAAQALLFESFEIADGMLKGREFFFDHFTAADAHFFWCMRRGAQLDCDLSGFPNALAHFERIKARPSAQKVLAYEKSVQDQFAKAA